MRRCTRCILPEGYPGISFDEKGVCSLCVDYREKQYLGDDALRHRIESFLEIVDRNQSYHCILGFSGGRDSSYLLYYLSKVLDLRVLCYSANNGFIPQNTIRNMKDMTSRLNVKLVIQDHDHLKRCIRHHILSFISKPSPAMVGMLCVGCRLAIDAGLAAAAHHNRVPVIVLGGTPFEGGSYKYDLMRTRQANRQTKFPFAAGYLFRVLRNPKWVLNTNCLVTQLREYYYHYSKHRKARGGKRLLVLSPFRSYIRWNESDVLSVIENELAWKKNPDTESTWRGDCDVALLKLYLYKKMLGFNDKDAGLSALVRDGQISREQALERAAREGEIPEQIIARIFDSLELDFSRLKAALRKRSGIMY